MRSRYLGAALGALLVTAALATAPARPAPAGATPPESSGFNDWACEPSAEHPNPVILLHGLLGNVDELAAGGPLLSEAGYCGFGTTLGAAWPGSPWGGVRSHTVSARELAAFVERVRDATGARQVDLVGYSQGALLALYTPKALGIADSVGAVVAVAPATHGTTLGGLTTFVDTTGTRFLLDLVSLLVGCEACHEGLPGSRFITGFTATPIAQPGIDYTIVASRYDTAVTPTETSFVREPGVRNLYVQDVCPASTVTHDRLAADPAVLDIVFNALDRTPTAPVRC